MDSLEIRHPWTLCGLLEAFADLALAYFLLCVSSFAFFASKFLGIVSLSLPCPCNGVFGFQSVDFCWHKFLIDWPVRKICEVQMLAKTRFPFNLIWVENKRQENREHGAVELEGEACSSSFSARRNQNLVDRESGYDVKGKRLVNPRQRSGIRRRRRATLAYGKFASSDSLPSVTPVFPYACDCRENGDQFSESLGRLRVKENGLLDDVHMPSGNNHNNEVTCHTLELSGSFAESNDADSHSISFEKYVNDGEEKGSFIGSESDKIRMLERALKEEKASCLALYLELEKERAAAATAADEAMAMISRLQKDKASMEIEGRQYERMIEEKFAYDEEEIDILKEILVRREKDNHFLEKEIETYRRMSVTGDERSNVDISDTLDDWSQRPLSSPYSIAGEQYHKNLKSDAYFPSSHEVPFVEKQSQFNGHDLIEKTVILEDHVDHTIMLDSVLEDINDSHDTIDES